jgi:hypothetical protein
MRFTVRASASRVTEESRTGQFHVETSVDEHLVGQTEETRSRSQLACAVVGLI